MREEARRQEAAAAGPAGFPVLREFAIKSKLTEFNINSIDIKTIMAFFRMRNPIKPKPKRAAAT
jgi:hypothetical protein